MEQDFITLWILETLLTPLSSLHGTVTWQRSVFSDRLLPQLCSSRLRVFSPPGHMTVQLHSVMADRIQADKLMRNLLWTRRDSFWSWLYKECL